MKKKLVLHIPHSSLYIPSEYKDLYTLSTKELEREILVMTDRYTEELFSLPNVEKVVNPVSRLLFDPERFLEGEEMEKVGMGVCYTKTHNGKELKKVDVFHKMEIIEKYYRPHHRELQEKTRDILEREGGVLIVDCHSFSPYPLPYEPNQKKERPDICLGTDSFHTPDSLKTKFYRHFSALGYSVSFDAPYGGTIVPFAYLGKERRVMSIMIELNRNLYMDPETGRRSEHFGQLKRDIQLLFEEGED